MRRKFSPYALLFFRICAADFATIRRYERLFPYLLIDRTLSTYLDRI